MHNVRSRGLKSKLVGRGWPSYLIGGRVRTSTAGLVVLFIALFWVQQTFGPEQTPTPAPAQQVVPPGFVPDPDYTWVPRTQVQEPTTTRRTPRSTTTTTTPPTTTTITTPTTSPTPSTATTTVVDPDGPGLLPPQTVTPTPSTAPAPGPLPILPGLPG
jgi:hypothetical protein